MEKRRIAVTTLVNTTPEVAWALLISLLPRSTVASSGTRRPAWRDMIADDWPEDVSSDEYSAQIAVYAEIAIACAKREPLKLAELMENLEDLPPPAQEQVLAHINSDEILESSEDIRMQLWSALTDLIAKHRRFADADWAMAPGRIGLLTEVTERLAPRRSRLWLRSLFRQRDYDPYDETRTLQEQQAALDARRREAIEDVIARGGIAAVLDLAGDVESPWRLGFVLGDLGSTEADRAILPAMLGADKREFAQLAEGFVRGRFRHNQWMWADELNLSGWRATQIGEFMSYMPFSPETWARVARLMNEDEGSYWTKVHANPYELDQRSLEVAVRRLIEHRRPQAAIQCLDQHRRKHEPLDVALVVDALLAAVGSSEPMDQVGPYRIVELIRVLQLDPNTKPEDMFSVEWAYLPLLSRREGPYPTLLRHGLATEPAFFCKVISLVFRSKHEAPATDGENSSAESVEETRAANAYRLLREWRSPPGVQSDGSYDGNALHAWLDEVKRICTQSGHLEIAMTFVGHVLTYSPPDPDGLWIHRAAAGALNERDAGDMRDGFRTELFNSRGVHGFTAGGEEHELSTKYQARAEEVEAAGYHRLAATLSGLAASYERQAEREASRDPFDER